MARVGPERTVQQNFAAGMFRSVDRHLIPRAGVYDATNALLDEDGAMYRRGGSEYVPLLAGEVGSAGDSGTIYPDGDNGGWAASNAPSCWQAINNNNPGDYAFTDGLSSVDFSMQDISLGSGEGLASLTAVYTPWHDAGVVVAIEIVDGSGAVLASSTGSSVTYTWPTPIAEADANAVKVRLRVVTIWAGVTFARTDALWATWTKGETDVPALPAADLAAEPTFLWHGWLSAGSRIVMATPSDFWLVTDGNVAQNIGGSGLAAPGRPAVLDGKMYLPGGAVCDGTDSVGTAAKTADFYAAVAGRLLAAKDDRIDFSAIKDPTSFASDDFHKLPGGVKILGLEALRTSAVVFTTAGIWVIGNLDQNLTDDAGNVQQRLDHYSTDLVLWGDSGIAGWSGSLVVPARDGVWLMSLGVTSEAVRAFERISQPIDRLYRDYVAQGCRPGQAAIFRGHYILPILSGQTVVDTLVCRIDRPVRIDGQTVRPWTHLKGYGAQVPVVAVARRTPDERLLGGGDHKLMELKWFQPSAASTVDADGSAHAWDITTRDYATGGLNLNTVLRMRATYELAGADDPTISAFVGVGHDPSEVLTEQLVGEAPVDEDGLVPHSWPVVRRCRHVRFRLVCEDAVERLRLQAVEVLTRLSGKIN